MKENKTIIIIIIIIVIVPHESRTQTSDTHMKNHNWNASLISGKQ